MPQQSLPRSRKIRVLYVDDVHSDDEDRIREHIETSTDNFWEAATQLCEVKHERQVPCDKCLFTFDFFPHFPAAMYALLKGERYDVYLVDIHADQSIASNRWDAAKYRSDALEFRERLCKWFQLQPGDVINGEHHIMPLIARLPHTVHPYIVWWSAKFNPQHALEEGGQNISLIATKDKDLGGILVTAVNYFRNQFLDRVSVPVPSKAIDQGVQYPAYVNFHQNHLRINTDVEIRDTSGNILTRGLSKEFGDSYILKVPGGARHGLLLRYLMRGGKVAKVDKAKTNPSYSRFFSDGLKKPERARQHATHGDLSTVLNALRTKLESSHEYTRWDNTKGLDVKSSTELAWRYLYHSIVQLYVYSRAQSEDLSDLQGTALAKDAEQFSDLDSLLTSREFAEHALTLGTDNFGKECGDLELLWIPRLVCLAIDIEERHEQVLRRLADAREAPAHILSSMLNEADEGERILRIPFFRGWYLSDEIYDLFRTLQQIDEESKNPHALKRVLFKLYMCGRSLHERF